MQQDVFLSHASRDKATYVDPLTNALRQRKVTFWLDSIEISWGDNLVNKINAGLRNTRYALVCLSAHFLDRPWPEAELSAALSLQNSNGQKRVLPLILNCRERVLQQYPLIGGMTFREFDVGPEALADELANLLRPNRRRQSDSMRVTLESVHTGLQSYLNVTPKTSVRWLRSIATKNLGLRDEADAGAFETLRVRWVLVDTKAVAHWDKMAASNTTLSGSRGVVRGIQ
jgi:hypothetical protein